MGENKPNIETQVGPYRFGKGKRNPNWKGGRSVASNGYVLVRVGTEHHLSDVRGYAYEHRIEAEKKIGRRLEPWEQVHHINRDRSDNRHENIEVLSTLEHGMEHRKRKDLQDYHEINDLIVCECGCGAMLPRYDKYGRPRRFLPSHNMRIRGY
jgi:hypothetical protein